MGFRLQIDCGACHIERFTATVRKKTGLRASDVCFRSWPIIRVVLSLLEQQ